MRIGFTNYQKEFIANHLAGQLKNFERNEEKDQLRTAKNIIRKIKPELLGRS